MKKISKNAKTNYILNSIYDGLVEMGVNEVKRYKEEFPKEIDYNIVQYGNLLVYYSNVQELFKKAGYKTKMTNEKAWETYKGMTRRAVNYLLNELK